MFGKSLIIHLIKLMKQLFTAIAICLVCFACEKEESKDSTDFFPLAVGNKWTYQVIYEGDVIDTVITEIKNKARIHYNDTNYECYFLSKSELSQGNSSHVRIFAHDKDGGVLQVGACTPNDTLIAPSTMYKYPVVTGDYWNVNILEFVFRAGDDQLPDIEQFGTDEYVCTDIDKVIAINNTIYHCVVYKSEFSPIGDLCKTLMYLAPGKGLVRVEQYNNDILDYEWQLLELKVN